MTHTFIIYPVNSFWYSEELPMDTVECTLLEVQTFVNNLLDYLHYKSYSVISTDGKHSLEIGEN